MMLHFKVYFEKGELVVSYNMKRFSYCVDVAIKQIIFINNPVDIQCSRFFSILVIW